MHRHPLDKSRITDEVLLETETIYAIYNLLRMNWTYTLVLSYTLPVTMGNIWLPSNVARNISVYFGLNSIFSEVRNCHGPI